jgi:hypothetical protein
MSADTHLKKSPNKKLNIGDLVFCQCHLEHGIGIIMQLHGGVAEIRWANEKTHNGSTRAYYTYRREGEVDVVKIVHSLSQLLILSKH